VRKLAWAVVILLFLLSGLFSVRYVNLTNAVASRAAKQLLGLSESLLRLGAVRQAAESVGYLRGLKDAADFSLLVSIGAGSLALVCFVILAATHRSRRRDDDADGRDAGPQACPECDEPIRGFELACRSCGHRFGAWSRR
jgi:hypothetical protein